jgi:hypothetical protein
MEGWKDGRTEGWTVARLALPIFHPSTLQDIVLRDNLAGGAEQRGRGFFYLHSRGVPDGK